MPALSANAAHTFTSALMNAVKASGELGAGSAPSSASRRFTSSRVSALPTSAEMRAARSGGIAGGAKTPNHAIEAKPGRPVSDIGRAIEAHATAYGYGVVRAFCGHGIGENFHYEPQVLHYFDPEASTIMEEGMFFTVEPMITSGKPYHVVWPDGWTAVAADGERAAQFEHTVMVTEGGAEILTLS